MDKKKYDHFNILICVAKLLMEKFVANSYTQHQCLSTYLTRILLIWDIFLKLPKYYFIFYY